MSAPLRTNAPTGLLALPHLFVVPRHVVPCRRSDHFLRPYRTPSSADGLLFPSPASMSVLNRPRCGSSAFHVRFPLPHSAGCPLGLRVHSPADFLFDFSASTFFRPFTPLRPLCLLPALIFFTPCPDPVAVLVDLRPPASAGALLLCCTVVFIAASQSFSLVPFLTYCDIVFYLLTVRDCLPALATVLL